MKERNISRGNAFMFVYCCTCISHRNHCMTTTTSASGCFKKEGRPLPLATTYQQHDYCPCQNPHDATKRVLHHVSRLPTRTRRRDTKYINSRNTHCENVRWRPAKAFVGSVTDKLDPSYSIIELQESVTYDNMSDEERSSKGC